jgi:hypothetical protein
MATSVLRSNEAKVKVEFEIIHAVLFDERGLDAGCHFGPGRFGRCRFGRSRFGRSRFGPGYFGSGYFGIPVMYLNHHDDLLKNRKRFNYHMDDSDLSIRKREDYDGDNS